MKNKKILSLLLSCIVISYLTGCSNSEKIKPDISENFGDYYTVTDNVTLPYDLAYADDICSADGNIYVCGYSYITNQNSVFSLYDSVSGSLDEISVQSSETGDVTAVYLGDDRFYAGYRNGSSSWFCIYDVKTGNEIKKIPVEDNMRIASFFEDSEGGIIIDIRDTFGFGYIDKCSSGYTMTGKISIYDQISSRNMKILNMIYCNGCYWAVAEENVVSEEKINVFRVSEDGTLNESFYGAVPESDGRYLTSFINP